MTVDVEKSLRTYLWNRLTTDAALIAALDGEVRCYFPWAVPDAPFPYLVHRLNIRKSPGTHVIQVASYYLDIWSDSPNADELSAIRVLIVGLLDELVFETDEAKQCHIEFSAGDLVVSSAQDIWHYAFIWDMIFRRDAEAGLINVRNGRS